jgi:hypothetical protein
MNSAIDFKSADTAAGDRLPNIYKIWKQLACDRFAPKREEISPAKLRALLPWTWVVDVTGNDFRFRIAGERVVEYLGHRHAGMLLSELRGLKFFELMHALFSHCVAQKKPIVHGPFQSSHANREHLEAEVLVLPHSEDGIHVTALCGGFEYWPYGTHFRKISAQRSVA